MRFPLHLPAVPLWGALGLGLLLVLTPALVSPSTSWAEDAAPASRADWEQQLEALDATDARAATALALRLEAKGHEDLARRAYEIVLAISPDHAVARRALGYERVDGRWLSGADRQRAKGLIHHAGRWMTSEEFAQVTRPQRDAAEQKAGEKRVYGLLARIGADDEETANAARREMMGVDARFKLEPLAKALRAKPDALRLYAAEQLGVLADPLAVPALLRRAIVDPNADVRAAVADALATIGEPSTVHPLGRALDSNTRDVRIRAAEALGRLGDEMALPYLIKRWEGRSGDFPRAYFSQVRQLSYIQDFDVEVAQTSFIADPIVGVLQEGAVQAVKVQSTVKQFTTIEKAAVKGALNKLAGVDHGDNVGAWKRFWHQEGERLLDERAARYRAADRDPSAGEK